MSKPKYTWWGYAKSMVKRYPEKVNEDERNAVEAAIAKTKAMKTGDVRMEIVEMVLLKKTHTIDGAAMAAYCSPSMAKTYHTEFIRLVGKNFCCKELS